MESRAKIAGHPAHPMFIVFPIGLFVVGMVFDLIAVSSGERAWSTAAFWNIAAGGIGAGVAAVAGLVDWMAVPAGTRAKAIGLYHGVGNVVVLTLFAIAWALRFDEPARMVTTPALALEVIGAVLLLVTGWLGGELVDRLGIGVDDGAHADSPSSLSHHPASDVARRPGPTLRGPERGPELQPR